MTPIATIGAQKKGNLIIIPEIQMSRFSLDGSFELDQGDGVVNMNIEQMEKCLAIARAQR